MNILVVCKEWATVRNVLLIYNWALKVEMSVLLNWTSIDIKQLNKFIGILILSMVFEIFVFNCFKLCLQNCNI